MEYCGSNLPPVEEQEMRIWYVRLESDETNAIEKALKDAGHELVTCTMGEEFMNSRGKAEPPEVAIIEQTLAGPLRGLEVLDKLAPQGKSTPFPVILASASPNVGRLAQERKVTSLVSRDPAHFVRAVKRIEKPPRKRR
jgi:DNA-binding NtrC family response regulator